jgi:hypothetical protein
MTHAETRTVTVAELDSTYAVLAHRGDLRLYVGRAW